MHKQVLYAILTILLVFIGAMLVFIRLVESGQSKNSNCYDNYCLPAGCTTNCWRYWESDIIAY